MESGGFAQVASMSDSQEDRRQVMDVDAWFAAVGGADVDRLKEMLLDKNTDVNVPLVGRGTILLTDEEKRMLYFGNHVGPKKRQINTRRGARRDGAALCCPARQSRVRQAAPRQWCRCQQDLRR